jgi:hypothetical protein
MPSNQVRQVIVVLSTPLIVQGMGRSLQQVWGTPQLVIGYENVALLPR